MAGKNYMVEALSASDRSHFVHGGELDAAAFIEVYGRGKFQDLQKKARGLLQKDDEEARFQAISKHPVLRGMLSGLSASTDPKKVAEVLDRRILEKIKSNHTGTILALREEWAFKDKLKEFPDVQALIKRHSDYVKENKVPTKEERRKKIEQQNPEISRELQQADVKKGIVGAKFNVNDAGKAVFLAGKYKGVALRNVPVAHLLYLYRSGKFDTYGKWMKDMMNYYIQSSDFRGRYKSFQEDNARKIAAREREDPNEPKDREYGVLYPSGKPTKRKLPDEAFDTAERLAKLSTPAKSEESRRLQSAKDFKRPDRDPDNEPLNAELRRAEQKKKARLTEEEKEEGKKGKLTREEKEEIVRRFGNTASGKEAQAEYRVLKNALPAQSDEVASWKARIGEMEKVERSANQLEAFRHRIESAKSGEELDLVGKEIDESFGKGNIHPEVEAMTKRFTERKSMFANPSVTGDVGREEAALAPSYNFGFIKQKNRVKLVPPLE
jgi:hypothetical protein